MTPEDRIRQALKVTETGAMVQFNKDSQFAQSLRDLLEELATARWLISAENIEHLAADIADACVNPMPMTRKARHTAMVRLGQRLRKPLTMDLNRREKNNAEDQVHGIQAEQSQAAGS